MLVVPDLTECKDTVGPGVYKARILDATMGEWAATDSRKAIQFVNWRLTTFGEVEDKNNGRSIFAKTPLAGGGAFKIRDLYKAATGEEYKPGGFDTDQLLGKEVSAIVTTDQKGYQDVKFRAL